MPACLRLPLPMPGPMHDSSTLMGSSTLIPHLACLPSNRPFFPPPNTRTPHPHPLTPPPPNLTPNPTAHLLQLFLPHASDAGTAHRVLLRSGAAVMVRGARAVRLRRGLDLPAISLSEFAGGG